MRTLHGSRPGTNVSDNAKSRIAGECVCFSTALEWERTENRPRKAAVNRRTLPRPRDSATSTPN